MRKWRQFVGKKKKKRKMVRAEEEEEEVSPLPSPNDDGGILSSSRNPITPIFHSILAAAISPTGQCSDRAHRDFRCDEPFHGRGREVNVAVHLSAREFGRIYAGC